ncbi:MAG: hydroxymethylbilane synthase, partial [Chloroflexota bacterium]|nr:hydroxymethylbilane synthase [Chloroflexota bacterium]
MEDKVANVSMVLRLGTRGSKLARAQTKIVVDALKRIHPALVINEVIIRTEGDVDKVSPLSEIGGRGVFTAALEAALRIGSIDVAVHSAKDLPTADPPDLALIAFLAREDPRDVFVSRCGGDLDSLPLNPTIGTSSRRREAEMLVARPDARIVPLRGNVDTRLRKARAGVGGLDGIVLAAAGLIRLGWSEAITSYLSVERFVPSPGQGALALQTRSNDRATIDLISPLNEPPVSTAVNVERAFLRAAGGGCTAPIGAYAQVRDGAFFLHALIGAEDGHEVVCRGIELPTDKIAAEDAATELAREMVESINPTRHEA